MGERARADNIKDACVDEAFRIIEAGGLEKLSLREVARRLGVSHQAPYKHFPSRDHILAAVVARCYGEFAAGLEARPRSDDAWADLAAMGEVYLAYARAHPLKYRLMFNTALPDPDVHKEMTAQAAHAFSILRDRLETMSLRPTGLERAAGGGRGASSAHDALFIWACLHGLASLMQSDAARALSLDDETRAAAMGQAMARLSLALGAQGET